MDCRVDDGQISPLRCRLLCDLQRLPEDFPWATDDRAALAYTDAERDAIAAALDKLKIPYVVEAVDQPDPTHLALCQGQVRTRSEALAALAALAAGETPDIPELRLSQLETDVAGLKAAPKVVEP